MSQPFPQSPYFSGNFAPITFEAEADNLPIRGEMPKELRGSLYRNGPNPQFAPRDNNYHWFIGDGMIHGFHIADCRVSYRNRWVRTPKFQWEHDAGKSLVGSWGNPMTTDPSVLGKENGGVANTNIVWHGGKLLALEEAHLPQALDPVTLATGGAWDFAGALKGGKVTAHPKLDPETGEMVFFAYSDGGFFSKTMCYGVLDKTGKITRLDKFEAPFSAMVHDFLVTRNYVLFPIMPLTGSLERAMSGKPAYAWEPGKGVHVGVMKRDAAVSTIRWFQTDPCYVFHFMNAYEDGGKLIADGMQYEVAPLFPDPDGKPGDPAKALANLTRWTFDLAGNSNSFKRERLDDLSSDFPRLDERYAGLPYRHGYYAASADREHVQGFDVLAHVDHATGKRTTYQLPKGDVTSEPVFVPRRAKAPEGDGYLLATVWRAAEKRSDLVVLDATALDKGPVAVAELSHRVPFGFHGNWRQG
jgi:carotenoid cleavage dioxygenase-like enzyme